MARGELATLEVIDQWCPPPIVERGSGRRTLGASLASLALVALVIASMARGASGNLGESGGQPGPVGGSGQPDVPPPRLASPLGQRLVTLTLTGLAVVDLDQGRFEELDLGAVQAFGASQALAPLDHERAGVLFADRSVGVVDLGERSITRVAEDVQAVFPTGEPGGMWLRRTAERGWELNQVDADGRAVSVAMHFPTGVPPRIVGGRPITSRQDSPILLSQPDGPYRVEVREHRDSVSSFEVVVTDPTTGDQRELADVAQLPVLSADGRRLLVAEAVGNRLSVYDLQRWTVETVDVPRSGSVGLDWGNAVLLPPPTAGPDGNGAGVGTADS